MSDLTALEHAAELDLVSQALASAGHASTVLEPGEQLPVTTLLIELDPDDEDRPRSMAMSIMPFGSDDLASTRLTQFYVELPFTFGEDDRATVERAVAIVNPALAIGHFGVRGETLIYRYVWATPNSSTFDLDATVELIALLAFHQEHFGDYFEGLIDDEIALSTLPDLLLSD